MIRLHRKPTSTRGLVHEVTPENAGWTHVGFALHRLGPGAAIAASSGDREICLVLVSGRADVTAGALECGAIGARMSPFEGPPYAVYVPAGTDYAVTALTELELAVCSAPGGGTFPPRLIAPGTYPQIARGAGSNVRLVTNIMPEDDGAAASLLVVEVVTPAGNTSSYPSHKHDQDNLPYESLLEETYYHRLSKPQGFAFQRIYTPDRSLDEAFAVEDGDVVLAPRGYHPVATIHGYDSYYLNVMAGPKRIWKFNNAPEHAWLLA